MNNKLICVIGGGRWGKNHIRTLHEIGCLGGVVEPNDVTREDIRNNFPKNSGKNR